jgi:hypothetical protein
MGRSVSYHGTPLVYLADLTFGEYTPPPDQCDDSVEFDEDGNPVTDYWDFSEFIEDLRSLVSDRYPSLTSCDKWPGREDHAILENLHALFGVSEYCGLISVWIAPCPQSSRPELAEAWISQISDNLRDLLILAFPNKACYRHGTFSNGESVYTLHGARS